MKECSTCVVLIYGSLLFGKCFVFSVINIAEGEENSTPQPGSSRAPYAQNQSSSTPHSPDNFDNNYEEPGYLSNDEEFIRIPESYKGNVDASDENSNSKEDTGNG